MGSAASLQGQLATTSAEELRKVFEDLPEAERQKLLLAMTPGTGWTEGYGVCGRFASKDFETTKKLVLADAEIQIKEEAGAPWFTVLGKPSTNVDPPDTEKDKAFWVAAFQNKEVYHTEHANRPSNKAFTGELMATCATGNPMVDMAGSYRGNMFYMEKPEAKVSGTMYVLLSTCNAKNAESAEKLLDALKTEVAASMASEAQLLQCVLFPTVLMGGDVPDGVPKDDRVVKMVQVFKSVEVMQSFRKSQADKWADSMEDPGKDYTVLEFEASHFAKGA